MEPSKNQAKKDEIIKAILEGDLTYEELGSIVGAIRKLNDAGNICGDPCIEEGFQEARMKASGALFVAGEQFRNLAELYNGEPI